MGCSPSSCPCPCQCPILREAGGGPGPAEADLVHLLDMTPLLFTDLERGFGLGGTTFRGKKKSQTQRGQVALSRSHSKLRMNLNAT